MKEEINTSHVERAACAKAWRNIIGSMGNMLDEGA